MPEGGDEETEEELGVLCEEWVGGDEVEDGVREQVGG